MEVLVRADKRKRPGADPGGGGGGFDDGCGTRRSAPPGQVAVVGLFIGKAECGRGANASLANRTMQPFKAVCKVRTCPVT